jgi:hypothetical protein
MSQPGSTVTPCAVEVLQEALELAVLRVYPISNCLLMSVARAYDGGCALMPGTVMFETP